MKKFRNAKASSSTWFPDPGSAAAAPGEKKARGDQKKTSPKIVKSNMKPLGFFLDVC